MNHTKGIYVAVLNEGTIRTELAVALMRWQRESPLPIYLTFPADKPIENNRNIIAKDFYFNHKECEWLLQIDDDIIPPNNYLDLILHEKDIITGVCYAMRQSALVPLIMEDEPDHMVFEEKEIKDGGKKLFNVKKVNRLEGLVEVDSIGTGAILINRRVFDNPEMRKHPFITTWNEDGTRLIGQDLGFCRKAKENGFKIWVDTRYVCEHAVDCVGLSQIYETMTRASVLGGAIDDDYQMRRFDLAKPIRASDEFVLPAEQRDKLIPKVKDEIKTQCNLATPQMEVDSSKNANLLLDLASQP